MKREKSRTLKLQKWVIEHYEDWCTICGTGKYPISEAEFIRLGEALVAIDFEEITLVLLQCHYYAVQERAENKIRSLAETRKDDFRKCGLDPEVILQELNEKDG